MHDPCSLPLLTFVLFSLAAAAAAHGDQPMPPEKAVLVIHGGGAPLRKGLTPEFEAAYRRDLHAALRAG